MLKTAHNPPELGEPIGPFSLVAWGEGRRLITVSGSVAVDSEWRNVGVGDIRAQTRQVFANLETALGAAGAGWPDVLKMTGYMTDLSQYDGFNEVRREVLAPHGAFPASTVVQVAALIRPEWLVEVEVIALL